MRQVFGQTVLEGLDEIVRPKHTALLVVDLQNDFLSEGGYCHRDGHFPSNPGSVIAANLRMVDCARRNHVMVVYTRYVERSDGSLFSSARLAQRVDFAKGKSLQFCVEGTWGHQLVSDVKPESGELIIDKPRGSAFIRTDLDEVLQRREIQTLVTTGVAASGCVASTVRDALQRDYYVVVAHDCISDCHPDRFANAITAFQYLLIRGCYTSSTRIMRIWDRTQPLSASAHDSQRLGC